MPVLVSSIDKTTLCFEDRNWFVAVRTKSLGASTNDEALAAQEPRFFGSR